MTEDNEQPVSTDELEAMKKRHHAMLGKVMRERGEKLHKDGRRTDFLMSGLLAIMLVSLWTEFNWINALFTYLTACNVLSSAVDVGRFCPPGLPYWRIVLRYTTRPDKLVRFYLEHKRLIQEAESYAPDANLNLYGKRRSHQLYYVPLTELREMVSKLRMTDEAKNRL